jgi:hypothetical protein
MRNTDSMTQLLSAFALRRRAKAASK